MSEETSKFEIGERVYCERFPDAHLTVHAPLHDSMGRPMGRPNMVWLEWKSDREVHPVEVALVQKYKTREQLEAEVERIRRDQRVQLGVAAGIEMKNVSLENEVARLRAALEFYASVTSLNAVSVLLADMGERARKALEATNG